MAEAARIASEECLEEEAGSEKSGFPQVSMRLIFCGRVAPEERTKATSLFQAQQKLAVAATGIAAVAPLAVAVAVAAAGAVAQLASSVEPEPEPAPAPAHVQKLA